jgi:hypothetical protein
MDRKLGMAESKGETEGMEPIDFVTDKVAPSAMTR